MTRRIHLSKKQSLHQATDMNNSTCMPRGLRAWKSTLSPHRKVCRFWRVLARGWARHAAAMSMWERFSSPDDEEAPSPKGGSNQSTAGHGATGGGRASDGMSRNPSLMEEEREMLLKRQEQPGWRVDRCGKIFVRCSAALQLTQLIALAAHATGVLAFTRCACGSLLQARQGAGRAVVA